MNKVMLIGNVGKDPEVRHLDNGTPVANFTLATSESYKNKSGEKVEKTEWHNIVLWRGLAEVSEKYVKKGSLIYIEGKLETRSWEDESGNKKYITECIGNNMKMLGNQQQTEKYNKDQPTKTYNNKLTDAEIDDNDLPF